MNDAVVVVELCEGKRVQGLFVCNLNCFDAAKMENSIPGRITAN